MPMLKGTYRKRDFSPLVYSLVFEPTTSAETLIEAIEDMLTRKPFDGILYIRDRVYKDCKVESLLTLKKIKIENVIIKWESYPQDTISALELQMARFNKVKPADYDKLKVIPFRYCSNLSRGGHENAHKCGQRLLIERIQDSTEEEE